MTIELSEKDLALITLWYRVASGEGYAINYDNPAPAVDLILRLGIKPVFDDEEFFA